jgi:uncharacterized protein
VIILQIYSHDDTGFNDEAVNCQVTVDNPHLAAARVCAKRLGMTTPIIRDNTELHRFEIDLGGGEFAFAAYNLLPGAIRFYHTEVPESHGGQGLGTALIKAGLTAAPERGLKVIPNCPFFRAYLKKHVEEQDIVDLTYLHLVRD